MRVLGVDIGGTKCAVTACEATDCQIEVLHKTVFLTDTTIPAADMLRGYFSVMQNYIDTYHCCCIGVSCGGPLDSATGEIISPPNLPNFQHLNVVRLFEERFSLPAFLQNDANACALAEWMFGAGQGCKNMIFLTFGTGFGAGLILNGSLYEGTNGNAGEVGHIRMAEDGPIGYGKRGSLEGFCSGGGIAQLGLAMAKDAYQNGKCPLYYDPMREDHITARSIAEAARQGDMTAKEVYAISGRYLGKGLSLMIDILNPQRIVIGSIFARSHDLLWKECHTALQEEALHISLAECEVVPAKLGEQIGDYAAATVGVYGMERRK